MSSGIEDWSRTVGETDINTFAYITGVYTREHLDRHEVAMSPYGDRVAHGLRDPFAFSEVER